MQWVLINTYPHPMDAQMDVLALEAEEIPYQLGDAQTVQVDPLISNAIGGVKLFVHAGDAERARGILQENHERRREAHPDEYLKPGEIHKVNWVLWGMLALLAAIVAAVIIATQ